MNINALKTKVNSPIVAFAEANEEYTRVFVYIEIFDHRCIDLCMLCCHRL